MTPERGPRPEMKEKRTFPRGEYQVIIYIPDKDNHYGEVGRTTLNLDKDISWEDAQKKAHTFFLAELDKKDASYVPGEKNHASVVLYMDNGRTRVNEEFFFKYNPRKTEES